MLAPRAIITAVIRTKLYLRVDLEHEDSREGQKLSGEVARAVRKIYGVREVEITHTQSEELADTDDEDRHP